jgi:hypothetical protein
MSAHLISAGGRPSARRWRLSTLYETPDQAFCTLIWPRFPAADVFARVAKDSSRELVESESLASPRLQERGRLVNGPRSSMATGHICKTGTTPRSLI